jgi:hypothetical protein
MFLQRRLGDDLVSGRDSNLGVVLAARSAPMASPWRNRRRLVVQSAQADAAAGENRDRAARKRRVREKERRVARVRETEE